MNKKCRRRDPPAHGRGVQPTGVHELRCTFMFTLTVTALSITMTHTDTTRACMCAKSHQEPKKRRKHSLPQLRPSVLTIKNVTLSFFHLSVPKDEVRRLRLFFFFLFFFFFFLLMSMHAERGFMCVCPQGVCMRVSCEPVCMHHIRVYLSTCNCLHAGNQCVKVWCLSVSYCPSLLTTTKGLNLPCMFKPYTRVQRDSGHLILHSIHKHSLLVSSESTFYEVVRTQRAAERV